MRRFRAEGPVDTDVETGIIVEPIFVATGG